MTFGLLLHDRTVIWLSHAMTQRTTYRLVWSCPRYVILRCPYVILAAVARLSRDCQAVTCGDSQDRVAACLELSSLRRHVSTATAERAAVEAVTALADATGDSTPIDSSPAIDSSATSAQRPDVGPVRGLHYTAAPDGAALLSAFALSAGFLPIREAAVADDLSSETASSQLQQPAKAAGSVTAGIALFNGISASLPVSRVTVTVSHKHAYVP